MNAMRTSTPGEMFNSEPIRILAMDVGAGTQDVLLYDSSKTPENCLKFVLPSQTQIVAARIREATNAGLPLHLDGVLMGGGSSSDAIKQHLEAGLRVTANSSAAQTLHNDLERVQSMGVMITEDAPANATSVRLEDVDLGAIGIALSAFGIDIPDQVAIAVQDHGFRPGSGNNVVRFEYLQSLIDGGGGLANCVFTEPPAEMTRMQAVFALVPDAILMDTGAAAVIGALGDSVVAHHAAERGAILVNVGNMHTFATLVKGKRLYGLFEHHTGGITSDIIASLVEKLRLGTIDVESFNEQYDGHGAALSSDYALEGPFEFVAVTGPRRSIAESLGYHQAAPHGDMMMTGSFGLAEGALMRCAGEFDGRLSLIPRYAG